MSRRPSARRSWDAALQSAALDLVTRETVSGPAGGEYTRRFRFLVERLAAREHVTVRDARNALYQLAEQGVVRFDPVPSPEAERSTIIVKLTGAPRARAALARH